MQLGLVVFGGLYALAGFARAGEALLVLGVATIGALLASWVLILPGRVAPPLPREMLDALEDRARAMELADARLKLQNDVRTTALQAIAGLAVLAGALLAFQQLTEDRQQSNATRELTLQGQASERFTRAIDQLGSDRLEVRLGGIYGLEQVAQQTPDNRLAVTEVLVGYLHRRAPRPADATPPPAEKLRIRAPDVQAALTVLVRRDPAPTRPPSWSEDLALVSPDRPLNLRGLDLAGADISGEVVLLRRSRELQELNTRWGKLVEADFGGTDLRGATFSMVELARANFGGADLRGADFAAFGVFVGESASGLEGADFHGAVADASTKWPKVVPVGVRMM